MHKQNTREATEYQLLKFLVVIIDAQSFRLCNKEDCFFNTSASVFCVCVGALFAKTGGQGTKIDPLRFIWVTPLKVALSLWSNFSGNGTRLK